VAVAHCTQDPRSTWWRLDESWEHYGWYCAVCRT